MKYSQKDSYLHRAVYNAEANRNMFEILSSFTGRSRRRDCGTYFGSIWGLLDHLVTAEYIWLNRFRALMPEALLFKDPEVTPDNLSWYDDLCDSFDDLKQRSAFISGKLVDWYKEYPEEDYGKSFQYLDSSGVMGNAVAGKAFDYLMVHQLHHRGQISLFLDQAGLKNNFADNGLFLEL